MTVLEVRIFDDNVEERVAEGAWNKGQDGCGGRSGRGRRKKEGREGRWKRK